VPYLPIDPKDLGRDNEAIIRDKSQTGKGGVAYLLKSEYGLDLPRGLQVDFAQKVQAITDAEGGELTAPELHTVFRANYLDVTEPLELVSYRHESDESGDRLVAKVRLNGEELELEGAGNGPIAAFVHAVGERLGVSVRVREYHEHALEAGEDARAAAYVEADVDDEAVWGVGIHASIVTASLRAVVNSVDRALAQRAAQAAALEAFGTV
jgi:2-isopropylmalate synthase